MLHINNSVLDFLQEAKKAFEYNESLYTYRNEEESYIALRYGEDRDCIRVYELGDSVFQLDQAIPPCPIDLVPKETTDFPQKSKALRF